MRWISLISSGHSIQIKENTTSSQVHMEHSPGQTDILGHKSNLSEFKKIEVISSIFSNQNTMRLHISYKGKKPVRNTSTWRFNNLFLNSQQVTEEIKREIKHLYKQMIMKTRQLKTYGMQQSSSKREVYSNIILPQETRKTLNRQPNFTPKTTGKRRRKSKSKQKERNYKDLSRNN